MSKKVTLTTEEFVSICALAYDGGRLQGEDTIGGLMKLGAFHLVGEDGPVVKLSDKIDDGRNLYNAMMDKILDEKRKAARRK